VTSDPASGKNVGGADGGASLSTSGLAGAAAVAVVLAGLLGRRLRARRPRPSS